MTWLSKLWDRFWNGSPRWAGLTVEESEEYDRLAEISSWRLLTVDECAQFWKLHDKVGEHGRRQ